MNRLARTGIIAAALALAPAVAEAAPANTIKEMFAELRACAIANGVSPNSELTVVFSLNRWGAAIGKPRISYSKLPNDVDARRRIVESVAKAIDRCLPLSITDALGGAIAGRQIALRLVGNTPGADI
jgi:hypothetical protein